MEKRRQERQEKPVGSGSWAKCKAAGSRKGLEAQSNQPGSLALEGQVRQRHFLLPRRQARTDGAKARAAAVNGTSHASAAEEEKVAAGPPWAPQGAPPPRSLTVGRERGGRQPPRARAHAHHALRWEGLPAEYLTPGPHAGGGL